MPFWREKEAKSGHDLGGVKAAVERDEDTAGACYPAHNFA